MDLLDYRTSVKIREGQGDRDIFDPVRQKWIVLLPEEFVRQLAILFLHKELSYPLKRMAVEKQVIYNQMRKRFDILVYNSMGFPKILVETKSPSIPINHDSALQIAQYNSILKAEYLWLSNGDKNLFYRVNYATLACEPIDNLPRFGAE